MLCTGSRPNVDVMIYESTLEDVDTAVVPYETAFKGTMYAMVCESCNAR